MKAPYDHPTALGQGIAFSRWISRFYCYRLKIPTKFLWLAVVASGAHASSDGTLYLSESDYLGDIPVVLSATRLSQRLPDAPAALTVIDRETIELSGAQNIPQILRLVPGIQVGIVNGNKTTVTHHGLSDRYARNMQVLVDGRSVYDAGFGGVSWADLPLAMEDIERIEVIRGPNSSAYGANAFSATINIVTVHPLQQRGTTLKGVVGNKDKSRALVRHGGTLGDLDYRLTVAHDRDQGLDTRHDSWQSTLFTFHGDYQINTIDSLEFQLGINGGPRDDGFGNSGVISDSNYDIYQPERTVDGRAHFQQIHWTRNYDPDNQLSIQFYHNQQRIKDYFQTPRFSDYLLLDPAFIPALFGFPDQTLTLGYGLKSERYDLELQRILRPADPLRLVWGLGTRYDTAKNIDLFSTDGTIDRYQLRAFANAEWSPRNDLVINVGAMLEKYEDYSPQFSPRLAINYHLSPNHTIRASATKAIRMPTLVEDHSFVAARLEDGTIFDVVDDSSEKLVPETIESLELGYIGQIPSLNLSLDARIYRDHIKDQILVPKDWVCHALEDPASCALLGPPELGGLGTSFPGAYRYINTGNADVEGFELGAILRNGKGTLLRLAYGYARARGTYIRELRTLSNQPVAFRDRTVDDEVPQQTFAVLLAQEFPNKVYGSVGIYFLDRMEWRGDGEVVPSYASVDLRLAKTFSLGSNTLTAALTAQNINGDHIDFQTTNWVDTRVFAEVALSFH